MVYHGPVPDHLGESRLAITHYNHHRDTNDWQTVATICRDDILCKPIQGVSFRGIHLPRKTPAIITIFTKEVMEYIEKTRNSEGPPDPGLILVGAGTNDWIVGAIFNTESIEGSDGTPPMRIYMMKQVSRLGSKYVIYFVHHLWNMQPSGEGLSPGGITKTQLAKLESDTERAWGTANANGHYALRKQIEKEVQSRFIFDKLGIDERFVNRRIWG